MSIKNSLLSGVAGAILGVLGVAVTTDITNKFPDVSVVVEPTPIVAAVPSDFIFNCPAVTSGGAWEKTGPNLTPESTYIIVCQNKRYTLSVRQGASPVVYDKLTHSYIRLDEIQ